MTYAKKLERLIDQLENEGDKDKIIEVTMYILGLLVDSIMDILPEWKKEAIYEHVFNTIVKYYPEKEKVNES